MSNRAITKDDFEALRSRRSSRPPMPKTSTILGTVGLLVTLGSIVWGMATLAGSKADVETVHKIQTDVEVIKTRQEMFIKAVRPGLPIGGE